MPTNKQIFETNIAALNDKLNSKAGTTGQHTIAQMIDVADSISGSGYDGSRYFFGIQEYIEQGEREDIHKYTVFTDILSREPTIITNQEFYKRWQEALAQGYPMYVIYAPLDPSTGEPVELQVVFKYDYSTTILGFSNLNLVGQDYSDLSSYGMNIYFDDGDEPDTYVISEIEYEAIHTDTNIDTYPFQITVEYQEDPNPPIYHIIDLITNEEVTINDLVNVIEQLYNENTPKKVSIYYDDSDLYEIDNSHNYSNELGYLLLKKRVANTDEYLCIDFDSVNDTINGISIFDSMAYIDYNSVSNKYYIQLPFSFDDFYELTTSYIDKLYINEIQSGVDSNIRDHARDLVFNYVGTYYPNSVYEHKFVNYTCIWTDVTQGGINSYLILARVSEGDNGTINVNFTSTSIYSYYPE